MVIIKTFPTLFLLKRIIFVSLIASNALFAVSIPRGGNILLRNQIEDTSSTTSEKKSYSLYLSEDNYGDHSTGIYKTTFGGSVRDPFGYGEKISGNFSMSDQDLRLGSLQISLPVGSHLGVFAAGVSHLHYALGDTFAPLEVSGSVRAVWMGYAQSLWKNHHDGLSYRIKIAQNRMIDDIGSEGGGRNQRSTTTIRNSLALTNSDRYGGVNVALYNAPFFQDQ